MLQNRSEGGGTVSDLAKWEVHGPVKTLKLEFATWDSDRHDWQPAQHFTVASFRPDGAILSTDAHNSDGTIAHSRWSYDDAGRIVESNSWMNDEPSNRTVHVYDETGRHIRTVQLNPDGTETDKEVCSYDDFGRKTMVISLFPHEADSECGAGNACVASTGYFIEGTDSAYGAPGATTVTMTYDENNLPATVLFHDANRRPLSRVSFRRDTAGRLLSEEMHQGERSLFQGIVDKAPQERREEMAAMLMQVLGETLSSTTYAYDAQGRRVKREHRMGSLGGDCTTYRYDSHDDPVEETVEHRSREASFDEIGNVHYSSDRVNIQHNRLEYRYDDHGNWTERIVSFRSESEPDFQRSNIKRRTITYYSS